jgi:quinol-cytochrome oxidoreductase complex cytochrome b subunit
MKWPFTFSNKQREKTQASPARKNLWPQNDKEKAKAIRKTLWLHFLPTRVRTDSLRARASFGLGVIATYLFIILCLSGFLLMIYYTPSVERAYDDMKNIIYTVPWGRFMRNGHRWSAHLMVAAAMLHLIRVFCNGAYKKTRKFNWLIGGLLFILTLGMSFTGYLLPWDQLSFWAITVGASMLDYVPWLGKDLKFLLLGSDIVAQPALLRFYVLHVMILPAAFVVLLALHIWRVRKDGGMSYSEFKDQQKLPDEPFDRSNAWPHLLLRLIILFQVTLIVVGLLAHYIDAPLEGIADPSHAPNPSKAPWYFLGLQEWVAYSAFWGGFILPSFLLCLLLIWPYLDPSPHGSGIWFSKERRWSLTVFFIIIIFIALSTVVGVWFRGPNWAWIWPWGSP